MNEKSVEFMRSMDIKDLIDIFAEHQRRIEELEGYTATIKAEIMNRVGNAFGDSKSKQHKIRGNNSVLTLTQKETVSLVSFELLKKVLKSAAKDFVEVETKYKLSTDLKEVLGAVSLGNYMQKTLLETLEELGIPEGFHNIMLKKLKGKPDKDKEFLKNQLGITDGEAETAAYFIREAIIWEKLKKILDACEYKDVEKAITVLTAAVNVNETLVVSVEKIG